jgi:hypothetical protein
LQSKPERTPLWDLLFLAISFSADSIIRTPLVDAMQWFSDRARLHAPHRAKVSELKIDLIEVDRKMCIE